MLKNMKHMKTGKKQREEKRVLCVFDNKFPLTHTLQGNVI